MHAVFLFGGLSVCFVSATFLPAQDNVLILLADDLGVDSVNNYREGTHPPRTPAIDALANGGVRFRNAWSSPMCSPTRAGIQTGRYAVRNGVGHIVTQLSNPVLSLSETTLPELLDARQSGYAHAAIGKWHLDNATAGGNAGPCLAGWGYYAGDPIGQLPDYFNWLRTEITNPTCSPVTAMVSTYATSTQVDDALNWIATQTTNGNPWVCYLAFNAPHEPFHVPPASLYTAPAPVTKRQAYKRAVEAMDTEIGRLLTSLPPGVLQKTNVFFVGDNGTPGEVTLPPFVPAHAKGTVYEGGVNVPFVVWGPAVGGTPGREEQALVSTVDLFATVAELCGVQPTVPFVKIDSVSLVPLLTSGQPVRTHLYTEVFAERATVPPTFLAAAISDGTYKVIRHYSGPPPTDLFFDLANDPWELNPMDPSSLTGALLATYDGLITELLSIQDTSPSFTTYGATSCQGSNGFPSISGSGTPTVGSSYTVQLQQGAPSEPAVLFMGDSATSWGGVALPYDLSRSGMGPGCFLYAPGQATFSTVTSPTGTASLPIAVPDQSVFVGGSFYHTWLVSDPAAVTPTSATPFTLSDGLEVTIGA